MDAIIFDNVTKRRGDFHVQQFDLAVKRGYITGLVGPNGSGKTSLISLMMGLMYPENGRIEVLGGDVADPEIKQRIGFVYDDLYMYDDYTIAKMRKVIAPLYRNWNDDLFSTYLKKFRLPYRKKIKSFSKGMRMKCSLLFALSHEPELLLLDEPTAGLDPIFRRELLEIVQELMVREEQTVLFSTHITSDLDKVADYIVFLDDGEVKLQQSMIDLAEHYHVVRGKLAMLDDDVRQLFIGLDETAAGFTGLYHGDSAIFTEVDEAIVAEPASLEDIMFFMMRRKEV